MIRRPINFLEQQTEKIKPPTPRWLIFLIIAILLLLGGCITRAIFSEKAPNDPSAYDPVTLEPKKPEGFFKKVKQLVFLKGNELDGFSDDRINVLALGMGGIGHEGPFLTDTMMLISIKPSTGRIAMISIPRDLGVKIPGYGLDKINKANSIGEEKNPGRGAELAKEIVEDIFNIKVHYYIRVDFKAFQELIDEVGGVTVNVDNSFTDHMFPAGNNDYQTVSFEKGRQSMSGQTALIFARSRHGNNGEGSDFARAKRQQKIILALKEKILTFGTLANPIKINEIFNTLSKHIDTDMEFSDIIAFLKLARSLNTQDIIHLVLDDSPNGYLQSGYNANGAFILEPKSGNFDEINETIDNHLTAVQAKKNDTPAQDMKKLPEAEIEIQNGTWIAGMAARMEKRLEDKGFNITTIGNTDERPQTLSGIYQISSQDTGALTQALQQELSIPIKQTVPAGIKFASSTDVLIILGMDMEE